MKFFKNISIVALVILATSTVTTSREWKKETSDDGKATVKYELLKEEKGTRFYYIAETTTDASLDKLDAYFSNSANHKNFLEATPKSEEVRKESENEWVTYYYFDAPWPMSDSEVVVKFTRVKEEGRLTYTGKAIADDYKKGKLSRLTNYTFVYIFETLNEKETKVTINADYIPGGSVPQFLINMWFPEGPANIVKNLAATKEKK